MRVGVIGGGPAGTICAIALRRGGGARPEVTLFDGKSFGRVGPQGCNMCAGVITGEVLDQLAALGVPVTDGLIQRQITAHDLETQAGGVRIPGEPGKRIYTVFRSAGPRTTTPDLAQSFDALLLQAAVDAGTIHVPAHVTAVEMPATPDAPFRLHVGEAWYEVDVLVGAFGVNSVLARHFTELGFGYRPPETYHVSQAELPVEPAFIETTFGNEIKIFSLSLPGIRFGALTPKRGHLTATVIGTDCGREALERLLLHPRVRAHLPNGWTMPTIFCHCAPRLPVTAAAHPVADRLLLIGDAHIARYLKGGIGSALFTAQLAARAILAGDVSRRALEAGYLRPCRKQYVVDNICGRVLFRLNDVMSASPLLARAGHWLVEREQRYPRWQDRHHTQILWHIFTGDAPYRAILRTVFSPASLLRMLRAMVLSACGRLPVSSGGKAHEHTAR